MRIAIIIITLKGLLNAQDSLYWFDMSKVRDSIPYTPKVLDKVFGTSQLKILDSLKNIQISLIFQIYTYALKDGNSGYLSVPYLLQ